MMLEANTLLFYCRQAALEQMKVSVKKIGMTDYEQHHYDKELISQCGEFIKETTYQL
jgi:hypothetical protein